LFFTSPKNELIKLRMLPSDDGISSSKQSSSPSEKDVSEVWAEPPSDEELKKILEISKECIHLLTDSHESHLKSVGRG